MHSEIGAMRILKAPKRWCCVKAKSPSRDLAELGTSARGSVIGEADEALVECGVPEGREEQAVVDVEALLIVAVRPGDDVGGPAAAQDR